MHLLSIMSSFAFIARFAASRPLGVGLLSHSLFTLSQPKHAASCESLGAAVVITDVAASANPLLDKSSLPRFKEIKPVHFVPALETDLNKLKSEFKGG